MPHKDTLTVNLSGQDLTSLPDLLDPRTTRLDASKNSLTKDSLAALPENITWLSLSFNSLASLPSTLPPKLKVLQLSGNSFARLPSALESTPSLGALLLNHNSLVDLSPGPLKNLASLNTLVLSNNQLKSLGSLGSLKSLKKLSAGHNQLSRYPVLHSQSDLRELRLNDNSISSIPPGSPDWTPRLEILDLGNNALSEWGDLVQLVPCERLSQLTLKGNPIAEKTGYREKILKLFPKLRVLDGVRCGVPRVKKGSKESASATEEGTSASIGEETTASKTSQDTVVSKTEEDVSISKEEATPLDMDMDMNLDLNAKGKKRPSSSSVPVEQTVDVKRKKTLSSGPIPETKARSGVVKVVVVDKAKGKPIVATEGQDGIIGGLLTAADPSTRIISGWD